MQLDSEVVTSLPSMWETGVPIPAGPLSNEQHLFCKFCVSKVNSRTNTKDLSPVKRNVILFFSTAELIYWNKSNVTVCYIFTLCLRVSSDSGGAAGGEL